MPGSGGIISGQTYRINVRNSGRALDANGTANNFPVQIYDYWSGANQQWTVTSTSGGYYSLTNVASGRVLDAASTSNNSPVQIIATGEKKISNGQSMILAMATISK